jgi:hypothetical protein
MVAQCLQFTPSMSRTRTKRLTEAGQDGHEPTALPGTRHNPSLDRNITMNAKHIAAALVFAVAGTSAFAVEATQDEATVAVPVVQSAQPQVGGAAVVTQGEATQFADVPAVRSREEVRAEGRAASRAHLFNTLYVGA